MTFVLLLLSFLRDFNRYLMSPPIKQLSSEAAARWRRTNHNTHTKDSTKTKYKKWLMYKVLLIFIQLSILIDILFHLKFCTNFLHSY